MMSYFCCQSILVQCRSIPSRTFKVLNVKTHIFNYKKSSKLYNLTNVYENIVVNQCEQNQQVYYYSLRRKILNINIFSYTCINKKLFIYYLG